jgi:hypothetical protein
MNDLTASRQFIGNGRTRDACANAPEVKFLRGRHGAQYADTRDVV